METLPHDPPLAKCQGGMNSIGRLHWLQSLARRKVCEAGENPAISLWNWRYDGRRQACTDRSGQHRDDVTMASGLLATFFGGQLLRKTSCPQRQPSRAS